MTINNILRFFQRPFIDHDLAYYVTLRNYPWIVYVIVYHITAEAPLSALKSAIAKNGMGVTSRP